MARSALTTRQAAMCPGIVSKSRRRHHWRL